MKSDHKIPSCKIHCVHSISCFVRGIFGRKKMLEVTLLASAPYLNRQLDKHGKVHVRKTKSPVPDPK